MDSDGQISKTRVMVKSLYVSTDVSASKSIEKRPSISKIKPSTWRASFQS